MLDDDVHKVFRCSCEIKPGLYCGGRVSPKPGVKREYERREGVMFYIPDDMLMPTCNECGEFYFFPAITAEIEDRLALDFDPDPGIRKLVTWLCFRGWKTVDSGDGYSKPQEERTIDGPHVVMKIRSNKAVESFLQLKEDAKELKFKAPYEISLSWSSEDDITIMLLCNVKDSDSELLEAK